MTQLQDGWSVSIMFEEPKVREMAMIYYTKHTTRRTRRQLSAVGHQTRQMPRAEPRRRSSAGCTPEEPQKKALFERREGSGDTRQRQSPTHVLAGSRAVETQSKGRFLATKTAVDTGERRSLYLEIAAVGLPVRF